MADHAAYKLLSKSQVQTWFLSEVLLHANRFSGCVQTALSKDSGWIVVTEPLAREGRRLGHPLQCLGSEFTGDQGSVRPQFAPLLQADGPDGRQARALGQDAAGRRYHRLGGDMGLARIFVDAGPTAPAPESAGDEGTAGASAADDEPSAAGMQRISSVASVIHGSGAAAQQRLQQQSASQQLPSAPPGPAAGAWGWYEADQLPALLEWLDGGDEGERVLADALFEAMLLLLPASLASTAPSQARSNT